MDRGTKILLIVAAFASFLSSLFTSPGPVEVLLGIATFWMVGFVLAGLKLLVMKLFSKRPIFMADAAWITLVVSVVAYLGSL